MSFDFWLWSQENKKHMKAVEELLTEITHRLIACEQSIDALSKQIEKDLSKGGAN